jgi:hypothetical protein
MYSAYLPAVALAELIRFRPSSVYALTLSRPIAVEQGKSILRGFLPPPPRQ